MDGDMSIQATTALPLLHACSITELLRKVIDAILPLIEAQTAETAPGLDVLSFRFPGFHTSRHLAAMHQPQMLPQVVFAVECSRLRTFLITRAMVVCSQMLLCGIELITVDAFRLAGNFIGDHFTNRCTKPLFER